MASSAHDKYMKKVQSQAKSKAKSKVKRKVKNKVRKSPIIITILILIAVAAVLMWNFGEQWFGISLPDMLGGNQQSIEKAPEPSDGEVLFHFIDVGQGDAILITSKSGNMLIDTSESGEREKLISYLDSANITGFKYVVFTHTDADHIGNADYIVENYDIENVLMPDFEATTKTYERLLDAIEEKIENNGLKLTLIGEGDDCQHSGYTFRLGSLVNTVLSPTKDYKDPNDMSIVIKAVYGSTSVMLTGDAEETPEEDILNTWSKSDLRCNVLKVGHHGSSSSTTQAFLDAVDPTIAVISCGEGNKYGHPHDEVMDRLEKKGITVYRTDTQGTIVLKTDGTSFTHVVK